MACNKKPINPAEAFKHADVIFTGQIKNLRYLDNPEQTKLEPRIIVTFEVSQSWKGAPEKTIVLHTTHNKFTCNGYRFQSNQGYLVYAAYNRPANTFVGNLFSPDNPTLGVKIYGGTKPTSEANNDLKYLNTVKPNEK